MPSILTLETASQNFIILFIAIVHQFNGNQIRDSLLDGLEKPSSASTGSEMSKSDSYQDFREGTCIYASIQICIMTLQIHTILRHHVSYSGHASPRTEKTKSINSFAFV